jgi:hypothetical protein
VPDDAGEPIATSGQLHHGWVAEALVEGARRIGDGLYYLQVKERNDKHQKQRPVRKDDPQNETLQRALFNGFALVSCSD